jgi:hypothetical protein
MKRVRKKALGRFGLPSFAQNGEHSGKDRVGPKCHLMRCKDMSGVEVKADSKANAEFGRG